MWQRWRLVNAAPSRFLDLTITMIGDDAPTGCQIALLAKDGVFLLDMPRLVTHATLVGAARCALPPPAPRPPANTAPSQSPAAALAWPPRERAGRCLPAAACAPRKPGCMRDHKAGGALTRRPPVRRAEFLVRCPAVLPNGTAVTNGTRYVLKSGRGPIQASPDCTTATCRPVLQDLAVLELTTVGPVRPRDPATRASMSCGAPAVLSPPACMCVLLTRRLRRGRRACAILPTHVGHAC